MLCWALGMAKDNACLLKPSTTSRQSIVLVNWGVTWIRDAIFLMMLLYDFEHDNHHEEVNLL